MPRTEANRTSVLQLVQQRPFEPFALNMENGDRIIIEHPENIAFDVRENGRDRFSVISDRLQYLSTFSAVTSVALIDKGVERQEAYKMVQRNAKKVWNLSSQGAIKGPALVEMLSGDAEVAHYLSPAELQALTNTDFYVKYIDTAFKRIGLN